MPTREQTVLPRVSRTIEDVRASVFGYVETAQDSLATYGYLPVRLNLNKGVVRDARRQKSPWESVITCAT